MSNLSKNIKFYVLDISISTKDDFEFIKQNNIDYTKSIFYTITFHCDDGQKSFLYKIIKEKDNFILNNEIAEIKRKLAISARIKYEIGKNLPNPFIKLQDILF